MKQDEFGYRVRQALNEGLEQLDYRTTYRLEQARQAALARQHEAGTEVVWAARPALAGGSGWGRQPVGWLGRLGLALPLLAIAVGYFSIYQYQESRRIAELADMDFAVLLDEVPLSTYADKGFSIYLNEGSDNL